MLALTSCWREDKKDEAKPDKQSVPSKEQVEAEEKEGALDNDDAPSAKADLTRDAPIEVRGGLVHDVGILIQGDRKLHELVIKNTSDKPLKLQSIEADCSCTNVVGFPDGVTIDPGEDFLITIRIDGTRIGIGPFEKHIILEPLEYKPIRVAIVGKQIRFYTTEPVSRTIVFDAKSNPSEKWEASLTITGVEGAKDGLELELLKMDSKKAPFIEASLEKLEGNSWKVTARPMRPLPYTDNFSEWMHLKVLKPEGMPNIPIMVRGSVGMPLRWLRPSLSIKEEDFTDGIYQHNFQLGIDLTDDKATKNQRLLRQIEKVDWQRLFNELEVRAPEGVKYEKKFTRFGVRLEVKVPRSSFSEKGILRIETGCNGNWEASPIILRIKKGKPGSNNKAE